MKTNLLVHDQTLAQAQNFLRRPFHALLITGAAGSGKQALAVELAANLLGVSGDKIFDYPYFIHTSRSKGKKDISIDSVRELIRALLLKVPSDHDIKRVALIEDAQFLSQEAQNALLKILEEPPEGTVFILTAPSAKTIAPTIASRAQELPVHAVDMDSSRKYFGSTNSVAIESAWQLSSGAPGLLAALLNESTQHPLKLAVERAKEFLIKNKYQRLIEIDAIAKDKEELVSFLEALNKIVTALHRSAITKSNNLKAKSLLTDRKLINSLERKLETNTNPKLIGLVLVLNLSI